MIAVIWCEIIVLTLLALYPLLRAKLRGQRIDYFESIYLISLLFWIVSAGRAMILLALRFDTVYLQGLRHPESWVALSLGIFAVTLGLIQLGYYWKPRRTFWNEAPPAPSRHRYGAVCLGLIIVSGAALWMLARRLGGIPGLDFTLAETLEFRGVFWLQLLAQSYFAALALAACVFFAERHLRYLLLTLAILAVIVLLEAGLGSKGGLLGPLLILLVGYHYLVRPIRAWLLVVSAIVVLVLVPITYLLRQYGLNLADVTAGIGSTDFRAPILLLDFMNRWYDLDMSAVVYQGVASGQVAHDWFGVVRDLFVQLIPSSFWPDKPAGYTIQVLRTFAPGVHSEFTGGVISFPATLYYSFSWLGVVIGAYLFGRILNWVQQRLQAKRDVYHVALYGVFLYCVTRYVQGLFSEATIALIGRMLPFLVLLVVLKTRVARTRASVTASTDVQPA